MTTTKDKEEESDIEREIYLDHEAKLQEAWKELDDERKKITRLDIEIANLKDENAKLEQTKENLFNNFKALYQMHEDLLHVVSQSMIAADITIGKMAEAATRYKFIIPEASQQSPDIER